MSIRDNIRQLAARPEGYATPTSAETREANKLVERGELHRVRVNRLCIYFFSNKADADRKAAEVGAPREGLREEIRRLAARPKGVTSYETSNPAAAADQVRRMAELVRLKIGPKEIRYFLTQQAADTYAVSRQKFNQHKSVKPAPVAPTSGGAIITAATKFTQCPSPEPRFKAIDPPLYAPRVYR